MLKTAALKQAEYDLVSAATGGPVDGLFDAALAYAREQAAWRKLAPLEPRAFAATQVAEHLMEWVLNQDVFHEILRYKIDQQDDFGINNNPEECAEEDWEEDVQAATSEVLAALFTTAVRGD